MKVKSVPSNPILVHVISATFIIAGPGEFVNRVEIIAAGLCVVPLLQNLIMGPGTPVRYLMDGHGTLTNLTHWALESLFTESS